MSLIYICSNDSIWLDRLSKIISNYIMGSEWELSIAFQNVYPDMLLEQLNAHPHKGGIYFLDMVYDSPMNGIALGQKIRELDSDAIFIYVTEHKKMMAETFQSRLQALDYIPKSDKNIAQRICQCLSHLEHSVLPASITSRITIQSDDSRHFLSPDDIYYINTIKGIHKVEIHTKETILISAISLSDLIQLLPDSFFNCNKGMLVNTRHVTSTNSLTKTLLLDNGDSCPCSVRKWLTVTKKLATLQDSSQT